MSFILGNPHIHPLPPPALHVQSHSTSTFRRPVSAKKVPHDTARDEPRHPSPQLVNVDGRCAGGSSGLRKNIPSVHSSSGAVSCSTLTRGGKGWTSIAARQCKKEPFFADTGIIICVWHMSDLAFILRGHHNVLARRHLHSQLFFCCFRKGRSAGA